MRMQDSVITCPLPSHIFVVLPLSVARLLLAKSPTTHQSSMTKLFVLLPTTCFPLAFCQNVSSAINHLLR